MRKSQSIIFLVAFSSQEGDPEPDKNRVTQWTEILREGGTVAVKSVLRWKELSSSSSKGNYELQKERTCLFSKVTLT